LEWLEQLIAELPHLMKHASPVISDYVGIVRHREANDDQWRIHFC
jgi:hypothetical protein